MQRKIFLLRAISSCNFTQNLYKYLIHLSLFSANKAKICFSFCVCVCAWQLKWFFVGLKLGSGHKFPMSIPHYLPYTIYKRYKFNKNDDDDDDVDDFHAEFYQIGGKYGM